MENFDELALTWDDEPRRNERAKVVASEIVKTIPDLNKMDGFEYGCGTGLLSFNLQPYLNKIWLGDSSAGMLKVLREKIKNHSFHNMEPFQIDLTVETISDFKCDFVYTLMTLHHIINIDNIINAFYEVLNSSGFLCIADLDKEDGSFHGLDFKGHNGFDTVELSEKLRKVGFNNITSKICYNNIKKSENGQERIYPVFVMFGQKV